MISILLVPVVSLHPSTAQAFTLPCTISTTGNAWNGEVAFGLWQTTNATWPIGSYLVVMKTDGTIEYLLQSNNTAPNYEVAKNIAQNTLLIQADPKGGSATSTMLATHIWNYVTNTTTDYPNVYGHHDIEYNPINNTFLTLQVYAKNVNGTADLFDKIVEFNATGGVLWTWDLGNVIPVSEADPFGPTDVFNGTVVQDFSHSNALQWDYNNNIVYLNSRHLDTFYKINMSNSKLIWAVGKYGNFTLLSENGTKVNSLWYHSHGTYQVAPNVFEMFDNDFDNETNPSDCQSRMIELIVNESSMTAYVNWQWRAPASYWSFALGSSILLPNGNRLGTFGVPSHQRPENAQLNFTNTGAIVVEVDPLGNIVRTYTFPVGWAIYRVLPLVYPTNPPFVTPTPTIIPTSPPVTATPSPTQISPPPTPVSSPTSTVSSSPSPTSSVTTSPSITPTLPPPTQTPAVPGFPENTAYLMLFVLGLASAVLAVSFRRKHRVRIENY